MCTLDGIDLSQGILRRRAGRGWSYRGPQGRILDPDVRARINALAIPPAYSDVWINPDPDADLQAMGRDALGRKQYIYHPHWQARQADRKFAQLTEFAAALPTLRSQVLADRRSPVMSRRWVLALMVTILDRAHIRVGSESYRKLNGTRGLTTLTGRHLRIEGAKMTFAFPGKSGQARKIVLRDAPLAQALSHLHGGPRTPLFRYREGRYVNRLTAQDLNAYLQSIVGEQMSAKTFRTWGGTVLCAAAARKVARSGRVLDAVEAVATHLGNTPSVARESYIHPRVLEHLERDANIDLRTSRPVFGRRTLSVTEQDVKVLID
ncbi:DNA topoisomerase IB [Pontivivens insulae]|nr:DNA topoisomerase IB [Pontivivens insulae]